ncbi:MAG: DEAD/DEAH box helicase [Myxococcota bacterium]
MKNNSDRFTGPSSFSSLGISSAITRNLKRLDYEHPSPIQQRAIPKALKGRDLLACAQTGTGKTAAFLLPAIERVLAQPVPDHDAPQVLVLSPTRELATQIHESFVSYARGTDLLSAVVIGGVPKARQLRELDRSPEFLIATPGRLVDLLEDHAVDLTHIETLVLDEADRMLDMGFIHAVRKIVAQTPQSRQTLMFSATQAGSVAKLARSIQNDPESITVTPPSSTVDTIDQSVIFVERREKTPVLVNVLEKHDAERAIVFTRTKRGAERVAKQLVRSGINAAAIHGNKSQNNRRRTLERLKSGALQVLVATDVASRGIDIDRLPLVLNFDLPNEPEDYVHRIGRTGRAEARGAAISLCCSDEKPYLKGIEQLTKRRLKVEAA